MVIVECVKGIILAGTGPGGLSTFEILVVGEANALPGRVTTCDRTRELNGERRVVSRGAEYRNLMTITEDNLSPQKARILLMLALTKTTDPVEIQRIFGAY